MPPFKPFNKEVLYSAEEIVKISREETEYLKKGALQNDRKRIRLCAHKDIEDSLHEMIIVHSKDTYIRPHRHPQKTESFHIIEGLVDIFLFDSQGKILQVISMGDYLSGRIFYYRLPDQYFHTLFIKSDVLIFHETTNGPFRKSDTIFASWAPEENDCEAVKKFLNSLANFKNKECVNV